MVAEYSSTQCLTRTIKIRSTMTSTWHSWIAGASNQRCKTLLVPNGLRIGFQTGQGRIRAAAYLLERPTLMAHDPNSFYGDLMKLYPMITSVTRNDCIVPIIMYSASCRFRHSSCSVTVSSLLVYCDGIVTYSHTE